MVTKWKSKPPLFLYALLLTIGLSGPLTVFDQGDFYFHQNYYHTPEFRQQLDQYATLLNLFELNAPSPEELKASIKVEDNEITDYRNQLGSLTDQIDSLRNEYDPLIQSATDEKNSAAADLYQSERDRKLDDLMKLYKDDDSVRAAIRKEKEKRVNSYFEHREANRAEYNRLQVSFDFYMRNESSGFVHTNLNASDEQAAWKELYGNDHVYASRYQVDAEHSIDYWIEGNVMPDTAFVPYQGWIGVPKYSPLSLEAAQYRRKQLSLLAYGLIGIALLVLCLYRFRDFLSVRGETSQNSPARSYYRKLPLDVKSLLLAGTAMLTLILLGSKTDEFPLLFETPLSSGGQLVVTLLFAALFLTLTLLQAKLLASEPLSWEHVHKEWPRTLLKRGSVRARSAIDRFLEQAKGTFLYKSTGSRLLVLAAVMCGLGFIAGWTALSFVRDGVYSFFLMAPILAAAGGVLFFLSTRQFSYLNRIAKAADELAAGRTPDELPRSGSGVLAALAAHINELRRGVKALQNEQAKSERQKSELITNVSHDLRTPLTSIITYAELLKSENATTEERAAYAEIIDQKSKRLKTMIDDLFEVSAMNSGNARLTLERTDLVQLMQQALAEYKEAMDGSNVQFRISLPEGPIYAHADGQKLWRSFDNLIGNMLKYSMEHTRAYIAMQLSERQEVRITFKNVSRFEIGDNAEEMFERFKRGDASRHTEGSGLGLAIAKSIVDLHEGQLTLETDGDLFKATVHLRAEDYPASQAAQA